MVVFIDKEGVLRPGWQIVLGLLLFILASLPRGIVITNKPLALVANIMQIIIYLVVFNGYFKFVFKQKLPITLDCFKLEKRGLKQLVLGMFLGVGFFSLAIGILCLTQQYKLTFNEVNSYSLLSTFLFYGVVGYSEEILTRGVIQHAFSKYGQWLALLLTSGVFSALHLGNFGITWNALLGVFAAGLILGMLMIATKSISTAIGFHLTWNWIQGSIYGVNVSGNMIGIPLFNATIIGKHPLVTGDLFGVEASIITILILLLGTLGLYVFKLKNDQEART